MMLAGSGFILSQSIAEELQRREGKSAARVIRPYINGGDLVRVSAGRNSSLTFLDSRLNLFGMSFRMFINMYCNR